MQQKSLPLKNSRAAAIPLHGRFEGCHCHMLPEGLQVLESPAKQLKALVMCRENTRQLEA